MSVIVKWFTRVEQVIFGLSGSVIILHMFLGIKGT